VSAGLFSRLGTLATLLAVSACSVTRAYAPDPGPYDRVPEAWLGTLQDARLGFERGDARGALGLLEPLSRERPQILPVRAFLQEVELVLLEGGERVGSLGPAAPGQAAGVLAREYEQRALTTPTAESYVLAARLASDPAQALELLSAAEDLDPACVWIPYGRAWWYHTQSRYREAREELRAALRRDAGHLPTLRLHATMLAGAGEVDEAAGALSVWLDRTADDPLFGSYERAAALLDLAALEVLRDRPRQALARLEELDPRSLRDPARAEEVRAAALEERGEYSAALAAAQRANQLEPGEFLPLVQEAMLLASVGDLAGEKAVWERLLERTEEPGSARPHDPTAYLFESMLFRLQAHARIERIERALRTAQEND